MMLSPAEIRSWLDLLLNISIVFIWQWIPVMLFESILLLSNTLKSDFPFKKSIKYLQFIIIHKLKINSEKTKRFIKIKKQKKLMWEF
jgi:hypothetical protein